MAESQITVHFTPDELRLWNAMQKLTRGTKEWEDSLHRTKKAAKDHSSIFEGIGGHIQGQLGAIASMAAGYLSVGAAFGAVNAALQHKEELERKARDLTITSADAQRNMLRNLGDVSTETQNKFIGQLQSLNQKYAPKGGMAAVYGEAASGLSASQTNLPATLAAMEAAMRFAPDDAETRTELVGAMLDVRKATGSDDAMQNLGLIKALGEQARATQWHKIARAAAKSLQAGTMFGDSAQETAALAATMSHGMGDPEMRRSALATTRLQQQLADYLPEVDREAGETYDPATGKRVKLQKRKGTGLKNTEERIAWLRQHREERELFLSKLSLEGTGEVIARELLEGQEERKGGGESAAAMHRKARAAMNKPLSEFGQAAEAKIAQMDKIFGQQVATTTRGGDVAQEFFAQSLPGMRKTMRGTFSREELVKDLEAAGAGLTASTATSMETRFANLFGDEDAQAQRYIDAMRYQRNYILANARRGEGGAIDDVDALTRADQLATRMRKLDAQRQEMLAAIREKEKAEAVKWGLAVPEFAPIEAAPGVQALPPTAGVEGAAPAANAGADANEIRTRQLAVLEDMRAEIRRLSRNPSAAGVERNARPREMSGIA